MRIKRYILPLIVLLAAMFMQAGAYAEVDLNDIQTHWAKSEITQMVEKKMILGYPDGTFKPERMVSKLDTLILASRVLGVDREENKQEVSDAEETYKDSLSSYNIYGKKEIAFLLSRKVLLETELDDYLKGDNAKAYTKRYEAAVIFTKLMGKEKDVKNKTFVILPFTDSQQIPLHAKPYVEFMNNQEIMRGVTESEFRPNDAVTRAQVAVMLLRICNKMESAGYEFPAGEQNVFTGIISGVSPLTNLLVVKNDSTSKNYTLLDSTPIKIDDKEADFDKLEVGFSVTVKTREEEILEVDAASRTFSKTVTGPVASIKTEPEATVGISQGFETTSLVEEYEADEYVYVVRNGSVSSLSRLEVGDFVTAYILPNDKVGKFEVEDKDRIITGVVESLTIDDKVFLNVEVDEESKQYEVMSNVTVYRNGSLSKLKDIKAGDRAVITLRYRMVKEIKAESDKKTIEGTIDEILISKAPEISIKSGDKTTRYDMTPDAVIKVDNVVSSIYDLRLGYSAEFSLDNNVVVGVSSKKKVEPLELRGTIKMINLNLGLITIAGDADSELTQIYVNTATTRINDIVKSTTLGINDLEAGQQIIAYGRNDRGVFVTSLIVVTSE